MFPIGIQETRVMLLAWEGNPGFGHDDKSERNKGGFCMNIWRRWQDVASLVIGALLLLTPFAFGLAAMDAPALGAWILSAVVGVGAVALAFFWLAVPHKRWVEEITILLGLTLFVAPWALGEALLTAGALASAILGITLILAAGTLMLDNRHRQARLAAFRAAYLDSRA